MAHHGAWTFLVLFTLLAFMTLPTYSIKVPIGVIFDPSDTELLEAAQQELGANVKASGDVVFDLKVEKVDRRDSYQILQAATRLMKKNVLVLLVPSTSGGYSVLPSLSSNVHVPVVSLSERSLEEDSRNDYVVYVKPDTLRAVLDVMRFYRWSNIIYLYDKDDGPERLQFLLQLGSGALNLNVLGLHRLQPRDKMATIARKLASRDSKFTKVLIDADESTVEQILRTVEVEGGQLDTQYLLMNPVGDAFWDRNKDFQSLNITGFDFKTKDEFESGGSTKSVKTGAALCADASKLIGLALSRLASTQRSVIENSRNYYNSSSASRLKDGNLVKQYITETLLSDGLTGTVQLDQNGLRRGYSLSVIETTPEETRESFTWTDRTGLMVLKPAYPVADPNADLFTSPKVMLVTSIETVPYLIVEKGEDGKETFTGFVVDLIDEISQIVNFKYKIQLVADRKYGVKDPSGRWVGMLGEVINDEVDMAIADLTMTSARTAVVDFTVPFMSVGISMLIKKPNSQSTHASPYFFLYVFTFETWCCLLVSFLGVGVLYYFVSRITSVTFDPRTGAKKELGVLSSLWYSFGGLSMRNVGIYPKSLSTRFLSGIWWIFVLFIFAIYIGGLITALLVNVFGTAPSADNRAIYTKTPDKIIEESLSKGYPEIGLIQGGSTDAFFRHNQYDVYKRFGEHLAENPDANSRSNAEGIERVRKGNGAYVFLMESMTNEYHSSRYCDLEMLPRLLDSKGYAIALKKGSPYVEALSAAIMKLQESGTIHYLRQKWWGTNGTCLDDNDQQSPAEQSQENLKNVSFTPITLYEISGLYYCLITGVILSLIVCGAEYFIKRRRRGNHSMALSQIQKIDHHNGDNHENSNL